MKKITIGSRGSQLSLIQTKIIRDLLWKQHPDMRIEIAVITTMGDSNMKPIPLDTIGKGWFTKELDKALLEKKIDLAVHSLKDVPEELPGGLCIAAIPQREDAADALVARDGLSLATLSSGAVIGTDSVRRKVQILRKRKDLTVRSVRGNVNRRLEKLDRGDYDALVLAVAGLKRLQRAERITEYFPVTDIVPAPGQGALAVVCRTSDGALRRMLRQINHEPTIREVTAERTFARAWGGGCQMPVGAIARATTKILTLHGMVASEDGTQVYQATVAGKRKSPVSLGKRLVKTLQDRRRATHAPSYIVFTGTETKKVWIRERTATRIRVLAHPTVTITGNLSKKDAATYLQDLDTYDWLIFTSKNGVRYCMDMLKKQSLDLAQLRSKKIAAVGSATAELLRRNGLPVHFIPTMFTTKALGRQIPPVKGNRILLARSDIADPKLIQLLRKKGAVITDMPVYKTRLRSRASFRLRELIRNNRICCIAFTSPSTVDGWMLMMHNAGQGKKTLSIPAVCIGPVTGKTAKKHGFQKISTARTHTLRGLWTTLRQLVP